MKKMFLFFSHILTQKQQLDAQNSLHVQRFVYLDESLQNLWSNVPEDLSELHEFLEPFKTYSQQNIQQNDIVLIQGDFGAVFNMVNFLQKLNITCVYATTKRVVKCEKIDNAIVKKSIFEHVMFREYLKE